MPNIIFKDLGLIDYKEAWDVQEKLFKDIITLKLNNRNLPQEQQKPTPNYLLFCEHPHVYTLGKSGLEKNLLLNATQLKEKNTLYYRINRGGDITYHGPGQLVIYPILDLDYFFTDIHKYLRYLEEIIILVLKEYNIEGERYPNYTGVWLEIQHPSKARKICAIGVRCSRWVTMHGLAFNINPDLSYFDNIIPCGISDKKITSLEKEIGNLIDMKEVKEKFKNHFRQLFKCNFEMN